MALYLFVTIIAFIVNFVLIVPFINFLYKLKMQRQNQETRDAFNKPTPIFDHFHKHKQGIPVGGGILIVITTLVLFILSLLLFIVLRRPIQSNYPAIFSEAKIIIFSLLSFSLLGIYDDIKKIFILPKQQHIGLRLRHKLIIEIILASIIAFWLFNDLKIDFVHIPFFGVIKLYYFYIIFAVFVIVAFANAVNITDGLDGLSSGVLMIALMSFWAVARSIVDVPTSLFIGVWLGGIIAFLYFNIFPARIMLGDAGALAFGATFAVVGLTLGKSFSLLIIGGLFVVEIGSSLIQLVGKKFYKSKIFPVSPFHLWLQLKGWPEPKIVMRFWLISILLSIFGLMVAFMK